MSHYSMGGYQIALQVRSSKTLLVEGRDDRLVLQRIFLEGIDGPPIGGKVRVDSADLVRDQAVSGMGAKSKVSFLIENFTHLGGKVRGLIDREWDFFCTDTYTEATGPEINSGLFVTRGHSIENYFFCPEICCNFLKSKYAHMVVPELMDAIAENFNNIVKFVFAYSVACRRLELIDRLDKFLSPRHLDFNDGFTCNATFEADLAGRGLDMVVSGALIEEMPGILADVGASRIDELCGRWNAHGHLGEDAVWACIGRLAIQENMSVSQADEICHGHREDRLRSSVHCFVSAAGGDFVPFDSIIAWART